MNKITANMEALKAKGIKRDVLDTMMTYVNKDLLICKLFYFFFFAAFGSLYPLLAIYFKQLGMNATQSGILIGFRPFIEFCSAPFWGGIADRYRIWRRLQLLSLGSWIVFTLAMAFVKPPPITCFGDRGNITIGNITRVEHSGKDLIQPSYSTVFYERGAVRDAFFTLLLIVVIGEFFSAPAITFADAVTLSYLGEDTDNYGHQRMFGSLGWGLSMFFVGMALDHSTTFPEHPCATQHDKEKNYMICFAVFSVLMSCALIIATQFKFPGQDSGKEQTWPTFLVNIKDRIMEFITGKAKVDREQLVEEDDEFKYGQPKSQQQGIDGTEKRNEKLSENGKPLQISLESKPDMVYDAINSPGAQPLAPPPDPDEPFLGRWVAVLRLLAQLKFVTVLFVLWFMGFGIGLIFTFLFWHLQDLGGSPTLFGFASVINHMSELLAYFLCPRFIASFGHINVLYAGLVGNVARFLYISWLKSPTWVLIFEFIQGLTHAAVWATTCSYVMQSIPIALRTSAQGILQGLHHGLGRGCGAVFGGILVYSYGTSITFRAYGVTCIFILAAFFGINYYLKSRGISVDSHVPHSTLHEEPIHFDPHGVPSGLARDLSSSKLNKHEELPMSYGATLGTNARNDLEQAFTPPTQDDDFNPRASSNTRDNTFNLQDDNQSNDPYRQETKPTTQNTNQSSNDQQQSRTGSRHSRGGGYDQQGDTGGGYDQQSGRGGGYDQQSGRGGGYDQQSGRGGGYDQQSGRGGGYDQQSGRGGGYDQQSGRGGGYDQTDGRSDFAYRREGSTERRDEHKRRASDESPRHSSEHSDRRERRRRQSGDVEGMRERDDPYGRKEARESRRHGDDYNRDESRGHRRHSRHRRSVDENQFQDPDPNPREKIVFEQLPDLSKRAQQYNQ